MPEFQKEVNDTGASDEAKHRANRDEGWRAPFLDDNETAGAAQHSIYDGKGNEVVVVTAQNQEGERKQGTGKSAESAEKDARNMTEPIGEGFYPRPGHSSK